MSAVRFLPLRIKFQDGADKPVPEEVQLLRTGKFQHPVYGKLEISSQMLSEMKKNFDNRARRIDLAIDYKHESEDVAAGWIKGVKLSQDKQELWAVVEWTPNGRKVLADREFRYLSADFHLDYQDSETLEKFGPTLLGAGLTNRPFVKDMAPAVQLTEFQDDASVTNPMADSNQANKPYKGKSTMDIETLKKENDELKNKLKLAEDKMASGDMEKKMKAMEKELEDAKVKLAEYEKKFGDMEKEKKLAELKSKFDTLLTEGKVVEAQREAFMAGDAVKFAELAGKVNLKEAGHGGSKGGSAGDEDADDQILKLAEQKIAEKKASDLGAAISMVLSENPELAKKRSA